MQEDLQNVTANSVKNMTAKEFVDFKKQNKEGPWALSEYQPPHTKNINMGQENRQNFIPGAIHYRIGSKKVDYFTETALKKKPLPAPPAYTPQLAWKPKNNF